MGRRRPWGSVRRLASGRYQARLPDGSPAPDTFPTKAEASRWLSLAEADLVRGTFVHPSLNANVTVAEWLEEWRASHSLHKRPTTLVRDESAIRRHLVPRLGDIQLAKLRQTDVQAFVADLRREVGPGTTRSIYGVLRAALNAAVNAELLARSPARGIKLPQIPKTDVVTLRPDELHRLAAALPDRWQPMVYVAGACGLRFSEVAGLRVGRVDVAHLQLQVTRNRPPGGRRPGRTQDRRRAPHRTAAWSDRRDTRRAPQPLRARRRARRPGVQRRPGRAPTRRQLAQACLGPRSTRRRVTHAEISRSPPLGRPTMDRHGCQPAPGQPLARPQHRADHRRRLRPPVPRDQRPGHRPPRQDTPSRTPPAHATPQPPPTTRTPAHGSSSFVPARSRHAAPSAASTAWEQDAATVTCAEAITVPTVGSRITCAGSGVRPRGSRLPAHHHR